MVKKIVQYLLCFCIVLSMIRIKLTETLFLAFLVWNLFLAAIPFWISNYLTEHKFQKYSRFKFIIAFGVWLLFLPNAPYMITDFIHLRVAKETLIWFDILLIFTYANTGLLLAIISISQIFQIIQQQWSLKIAKGFLITVPFLCGFGIYLGRVLRFNSWDFFSSPLYILKSCMLSFSDKNAWFITFGFGSILYFITKIYRRYFMSLKE